MTTSTTQSKHPFAHLPAPIVLVGAGAGRRGSAMLEGWRALGLPPRNVALLEPQPTPEVAALAARGWWRNPSADALRDVAAVGVAIKPQVAPEVTPALAPLASAATVVVSIMAGRTLKFLSDALPGAALVRAMPNTPAAIGRGITVAVGHARVSAAQRALADAPLAGVGAREWVA